MSIHSGLDNNGRIILEWFSYIFYRKDRKKRSKGFKIPYVLIAFFFAFGFKIIAIIGDFNNLNRYLEQLLYEYSFISYLSVFFIFIFVRFYKNKVVEVFLDKDNKFPIGFNKNIKEMLNYVFFNFKFKTSLPVKFKFFKFLYYIALLITPILGLIVAFAAIEEGRWGISDPIFSGFFGICVTYFVVFSVSYYFVGTILILSELLIEVKKDRSRSVEITPTTLRRYKDIQSISKMMFLGYCIFMIVVPKYIFDAYGEVQSWALFATFGIIVASAGFLIVLFVPNYITFRIISIIRKRLKRKLMKDLEEIERDITNDKIEMDTVEKYKAKDKLVNALDDIRSWPSDILSISQVIISFLIVNIYTFIKIIEEIL